MGKLTDLSIPCFQPPPTPKEIMRFSAMLSQVEYWINHGDEAMAKKYWKLIAEEAEVNAGIRKNSVTLTRNKE